jgi:hypothetical protein
MSSIRVAGVGGLGMVATIVVMAFAIPAARALLIAGIVTGAGLAWWLIRARRDHPLDGLGGGGPLGLGLVQTDERAVMATHGDKPDDPKGPRLTATWPRSAVFEGLAPC